MNITASQVNELRQMTGAGMMDCKKALVETDGDIEKAIDILRKKGMAKAAKRADREASEGVVFSKTTADNKFTAVIKVSCETDFVAGNEEFVAFAKNLLNFAVENRIKNIDDLKAANYNGMTVADAIVNQSSKTGEKTELAAYNVLEGEYVTNYNHPGNRLSTIVVMNKNFDKVEEVAHEVAMQVAAMNPLAVSEAAISQEVKDRELAVAIEKTKQDQIAKAIENALRKAGLNPNYFDSEDHIESNQTKGYLNAEEAAKGREIIAKTPAEVKINEQMVQNIANGRMNKFYKENCLLNQNSLAEGFDNMTVDQYIKKFDKDATVLNFIRVKLGE